MTRVRYDQQLFEGSLNPRPEWRNPKELDKVLAQINCEKQDSLPTGVNDNEWIIYYGEPDKKGDKPLVIACYQTRGVNLHLFTNNPERTVDMNSEDLLTDVKRTANLILESGLYPYETAKENAVVLRNMILGGGAAAGVGFAAGLGIVELMSKISGVDMPLRYAGILSVLGFASVGTYAAESGTRRRRRSAEYVIDNMRFHPNTYLHGAPAVHLIESYVRPVTRYRGATRVFDI